MKYQDFLREVATRSKATERKLAQEDVRACIDLMREVVFEELGKEDGKLHIPDFVLFDVKSQKGKFMPMYNDERRYTPDLLVPRVRFSKDFKQDLKREK